MSRSFEEINKRSHPEQVKVVYQTRNKCPACLNEDSYIKYRVEAEKYYKEKCSVQHATIMKCKNCRLEYTDPVLSEELASVQYLDPSSGYNIKICNSVNDTYSYEYLIVLNEIKSRIPPDKKILDFACGFGGMVLLCHKAGYDAYGIDLNPIRISRGTSLGIPNLKVQSISELSTGSFHGITAIHILEHIEDCQTIVKEFNRILIDNDNGYVFVVVPNAKSIKCLFDYKRYWKSPYQHINGFNSCALCKLFFRNGFVKMPLMANYFYPTINHYKYSLSMVLTKYLGNIVNFYPTILFCVFRKIS